MAKEILNAQCAYCGKGLYRPAHRLKRTKRHYCNAECRGNDRLSMTCEVCGVDFQVPRSQGGVRANGTARRVCSRACSDALRRRPLPQRTCQNCGCQFVQSRDNHGVRKFCSEQCREAPFTPNVIVCAGCSVEFRVADWRAPAVKFCSQACYDAATNRPLRNIACPTCGASFQTRLPDRIYCSERCFHLADKRVSAIEKLVENQLRGYGIFFVPQASVGPYHPDFLVCDTVIEVDGDYWHSDRFPKTIERDSRKDAFYASVGLRTIRIREYEVRSGDFSKLECLAP